MPASLSPQALLNTTTSHSRLLWSYIRLTRQMRTLRECSAGGRLRLRSTGAACSIERIMPCVHEVLLRKANVCPRSNYCCCRLKGQPRSWLPQGNTQLTLIRQQPITPSSKGSTAYIRISTDKQGGGLTNTGYWGVPVQKDHDYQLAVIIREKANKGYKNKYKTNQSSYKHDSI